MKKVAGPLITFEFIENVNFPFKSIDLFKRVQICQNKYFYVTRQKLTKIPNLQCNSVKTSCGLDFVVIDDSSNDDKKDSQRYMI